MNEQVGKVKHVATKRELDKEHSKYWGRHNVYLTANDISHLLNGGYLVFNDGEYSHGLIYEEYVNES